MSYAFMKLGALEVSIECDATYPDALDDITSRVRQLFHDALEICKEHGLDPIQAVFVPDLDEDDEEDED